MIKIELTMDDLDYDRLLDLYLPAITEKLRDTGNPVGMLLSNGMPASMAKGIVAGLPKATKDRLAAELFNANAEELKRSMEEFAETKGIRGTVTGLRAEGK